MEDLIKGDLGPEAHYDVDFQAGKLIVNVLYNGKEAGASLSFSLSTDELIDKLAQAIPGQVDDLVLELIKKLLKGL